MVPEQELDVGEAGSALLQLESEPQHRDGCKDPEVQTTGGSRSACWDRRTLYFCVGVVTASLLAVCIFIGMHFRSGSKAAEDCVNATLPSAMLNVQDATSGFSCKTYPQCPKHCLNDVCTHNGGYKAGNPVCTCRDKCEPDYRLYNITGSYICLPECCSTEESMGSQCCPSDLSSVTSDTEELFCCPRELRMLIHEVIPPFLQSNKTKPGQTADLCFTSGRTFDSDHVKFPRKPLTCN